MKTLFVYAFCLILLPDLSVVAQSRISVGLAVAPVVSHSNTRQHILLPDYGNPGGDPIDNTIANRSTIGGYLLGASARYALSQHWAVSTGFWYNRLQTTQPFPFAPGNLPAHLITSTYQVPLLLTYRLTNRRLSPVFSAGALGVFRRPTVYKPTGGSSFSETKVVFGAKTMTTQAVAGIGVEYRQNSRWSFMAQPLLIWHFRPNNSFDTYTSYQVNGQIQLMYSFR